MHRKASVAALLYNWLYPRPRPEDPTSFSGHLSKYLIPEIRVETALFYGDLLTIESRYPGLNYTYEPHIRRLSRFPHHRRLFIAVKALGITDCELLDLARWEGTLWARERYEKDEGIKVLDTTGDDIPVWTSRKESRSERLASSRNKDATHSTKPHLVTETIIADTVPLPCDIEGCDLVDRQRPASPAFSSASDEQTDDDESQHSSESDVSVPESTPHDAPSPTLVGPALFHSLRGTILRQGNALPAELRLALLDLVEVFRTDRRLSPRELHNIRQNIFSRLEQLEQHLPRSVFMNIASTLTLMLEQHAQWPTRVYETASLDTVQVIS